MNLKRPSNVLGDLTSKDVAEMTAGFLEGGGVIRKIPVGAGYLALSSLPRADRDAYLESRYRNGKRGQFYLTVDKAHKIEGMIADREPLSAFYKALKIELGQIEKLVHKMEASGIKFPEYLRGEFAPSEPKKLNRPKKYCSPIKNPMRKLTRNELWAFRKIRAGWKVETAANYYKIDVSLLRRLIAERFKHVSRLRECLSDVALEALLEKKYNQARDEENKGRGWL